MRIALASLIVAGLMAPVRAQQSPDVLAGAHSVQFENDWVRVVRVRYEARTTLPSHTHPGGTTVFVYLNDSEGIVFRHAAGASEVLTRPPVKTGGLRVTKAPAEVHTVENTSSTTSNFMRLHFKTETGGEKNNYRRRFPRAAVPDGQDLTRVEFTSKQMRVTRIIIQPGHSAEVRTTATEPAILVSVEAARLAIGDTTSEVNLVPGQERWLPENRHEVISNLRRVPVELIRVDFLTRPAK